MTRYLVDGMNVLGTRPDGWWKDRDAATARLIERLAAWAEREGADVTVVFDGEPPEGWSEPPGLAVVFVGRGASADDEIARRAASDDDPGSLTVVTSDRELAARVTDAAATVTGAGGFRRRFDPGAG